MSQWYKITAKKDKAKILIYEQIGEDFFGEGVSAKKFVSDLDALKVSTIDLHINSPGGSVFDGTSIYNALKNKDATVNVKIDGIAASIASVIAMAGDKIEMPSNALLMIHDPSAMVAGTAKDMEKMIEALDKIKAGMLEAYLTRATVDEAELSKMMTAETWFTADEAAEIGFIDTTSKPVEMAARFQALANFKNVPESILGDNKSNLEEKMDINLEFIEENHPEIVTALLKAFHSKVDFEYLAENMPDIVEQIKAEGRKEGAQAEIERIKAVREQSMPGHEALIENLMFDGETEGAQAAVKVLQAEKENRAKMRADLTDDAPDAIEQPAVEPTDSIDDDHLPIDQRCEARWKKDKSLHREFADLEAYTAYEKAVADGRVKVLN